MKTYYPGDIRGAYILGANYRWQELDEPAWCSGPRWPWLKRHRRRLTAVGSAVALVAGMSVIRVDAAADAAGDGEVTVHQAALDLATECYDGEVSSNGTAVPGSWAFKLCLDNLMRLGEYLKAEGIVVVDADGGVVPYGLVTYEVGNDLFSWMELDWKPE